MILSTTARLSENLTVTMSAGPRISLKREHLYERAEHFYLTRNELASLLDALTQYAQKESSNVAHEQTRMAGR